MSRFILITGKIGAGKSFVSDMLRKKHYIVIDSDSYAKRLYDEPELYRTVVERLGPVCLKENGSLDFAYMARYLRIHSPTNPGSFAWAVASRLQDKILNDFGRLQEVVFIEAAPTIQLGAMIRTLDINTVIIVTEDEAVRRKRLIETRGMTEGEIDAIDSIQSLHNNIDMAFYPGNHPSTTRNYTSNYELANRENADELNRDLMDILERWVRPNPRERVAMFNRYITQRDELSQTAGICMVFHNLDGCKNCPFPCGSDRMKEYMAKDATPGTLEETPGESTEKT